MKYVQTIIGLAGLLALSSAQGASAPVADGKNASGCVLGSVNNVRCCSEDRDPTWWCDASALTKVASGCSLSLGGSTYTGDKYFCSTIAAVRPAILKWGLSQAASDELRSMGVPANQLMQTIGNAAASAGTHAQDGVDPYGHPYAAAVDINVNSPINLSSSGIKALLENLSRHGFAAFYRNPGADHWPAGDIEHVHAIYVGELMKASVRSQVHDWLSGRNGLASHAAYQFWQPSVAAEAELRPLFLKYNP